MADVPFKTNPVPLKSLLISAKNGSLQLPDFQRSWVWDVQRIIDLLVSISRSFPIGAIMTLKAGGEVNFKPRPVEGASPTAANPVEALLLDGQQRVTSLLQVTMRGEAVQTKTVKNKPIKRWFYIDIRKAIGSNSERAEAIFTVPEDKKLKVNFGREVVLDVSTQELEFKNLMFPLASMFNWSSWQKNLITFLNNRGTFPEHWDEVVVPFEEQVVDAFSGYQVPVISLSNSTTKEAVCTVFEKVNTGGKALDAFELVTAMYAADDHNLRGDWYGKKNEDGYRKKLANVQTIGGNERGVLSNVASTDFLQVCSLFHTRSLRRGAIDKGKKGKELPPVSGTRQALLDLPLSAYKKFKDQAYEGFVRAAKFLHRLNIFRVLDLPYQTQVVPLAAILADIGDNPDASAHEKLVRWYWCGVLGELYGTTIYSRMAFDFAEVPAWIGGGREPTTIGDANFHEDRLNTMRTRLSAAYKGINALLMNEGAKDFRTGQEFRHAAFFEERVDIHHIFPRKWCQDHGIEPSRFNSIVNKTPLSSRTNQKIGAAAPSGYLKKLEEECNISRETLDGYLETHLINPKWVREDNFEEFYLDRHRQLLSLKTSAKRDELGLNRFRQM